jgi:K+-sensing histidine kinase KdpD
VSNRRDYISVKFRESKLRERNKELSFLIEMSDFLSSSLNLKELLARALSKVLEYFDLDAGRIYILDDAGQYLSLAAHQGIDSKGFEKLQVSEGFSGRSVRTQSFIAQHISELDDQERAALLSSKGFKVIICVPLISINKAGGVMNLASRKIISLDQEKVDMFTAVGNQIAAAANNARLYEDLEAKIKALKEKNELIESFAYSISHDLKSPAAGLYALTKSLQKRCGGGLDEKGKTYFVQILKTTEHIVALVDNINAYIETRESPLNLEKVEVKEITERIRCEFSDIIGRRHIRWSEPESLPEIIADRLALSRVFRNFTDNALKYGGEKLLQIDVGYKEDEAFHIFSFSDDGVGIDEKDAEKIFEIFHRHETSRGIAGSGLGLAIVKEVAARHQGESWMDKNGEKGATFFVSISKDLDQRMS